MCYVSLICARTHGQMLKIHLTEAVGHWSLLQMDLNTTSTNYCTQGSTFHPKSWEFSKPRIKLGTLWRLYARKDKWLTRRLDVSLGNWYHNQSFTDNLRFRDNGHVRIMQQQRQKAFEYTSEDIILPNFLVLIVNRIS